MVMSQRNAPKDSLLHELQTSLHTGRSTPAVDKMMRVEHAANEMARLKGCVTLKSSGGAGMSDALSQHIGKPPAHQQPPQEQSRQQSPQQMNEQVNPRDNAFDQQFSHQRPSGGGNGSLSQQLAQMGGNPNQGNHNPNLMESYQQMGRTNQPMQQQSPQQYQPQQQAPNQNINEQVNQALGNVDFGSLLQESLKNTVMELYAMEKIQKSLVENKDIIKKIVRETLIELSNAKKNSAK
jgi:hypothetical protein